MSIEFDKASARPAHGKHGPGSAKFRACVCSLFRMLATHRAWTGRDYLWLAVAAIVMIVLALAVPAVLAPFNRLWYRFGMLLSRIFQPVVLGLLFS